MTIVARLPRMQCASLESRPCRPHRLGALLALSVGGPRLHSAVGPRYRWYIRSCGLLCITISGAEISRMFEFVSICLLLYRLLLCSDYLGVSIAQISLPDFSLVMVTIFLNRI